MKKTLVAAVVAGAAALAVPGATPAQAAPACVAVTLAPKCFADTSSDFVSVRGYADAGTVVTYDSVGRQVGSVNFGSWIDGNGVTDDIVPSAPGGYAVLTVSGTGAAVVSDL